MAQKLESPLHKLVGELTLKAGELSRQSSDLLNLICEVHQGSKWMNVHGMELVEGTIYVARRLEPGQEPTPASLCRWTRDGWKTVWGCGIPTAIRHKATVDVWG